MFNSIKFCLLGIFIFTAIGCGSSIEHETCKALVKSDLPKEINEEGEVMLRKRGYEVFWDKKDIPEMESHFIIDVKKSHKWDSVRFRDGEYWEDGIFYPNYSYKYRGVMCKLRIKVYDVSVKTARLKEIWNSSSKASFSEQRFSNLGAPDFYCKESYKAMLDQQFPECVVKEKS